MRRWSSLRPPSNPLHNEVDFEKAYGRVDWNFLEGTMKRMGFPTHRISGFVGLYSSSVDPPMVPSPSTVLRETLEDQNPLS